MDYKTISLNDLYYNVKYNLEAYYQTYCKNYLANATIGYYWYKKRKGAKCIDRLEHELIRNELEYI